jgi:CRP-like cAMP-binding protein
MATTTQDLRTLPIFEGLTDAQFDRFCAQFEEVSAAGAWELFEAGSESAHLDLLLDGHVTLLDQGAPRLKLAAPAIIGELGVLTGLRRNTTARVAGGARVLRIGRAALHAFLAAEGDISFRLHQNLLEIVSDKVKRDEQRLADMRANIIATQKAMKSLRDFVLEQSDSPISERVHDTLEHHIARNRRVNYFVAPPKPLPAHVRVGGEVYPVLQMSRTRLQLPAAAAADGQDAFKGVLVLPETQFRIDGTVVLRDGAVDIELGLLIDEYGAALEDYLTRAQILDVVV